MKLSEFLPHLKGLVNGEANLSRFFNITINNIHIDLKGSKPEELAALQQKILPVLKTGLAESDDFLLETPDTESNLEEISRIHTDQSFKDLVNFIKKALPAKDYSLWITALMVRRAHLEGDNKKVVQLKSQMTESSGQIGNNIANICTGGYLESHIIPLYEHLVLEEGEQEIFGRLYELIIKDHLFAVFVSQHTELGDLEREISEKIEKIKLYHWDRVHIHAIGDQNVSKAKKVVEKIRATNSSIIGAEDLSDNSHLKITLILKKSSPIIDHIN